MARSSWHSWTLGVRAMLAGYLEHHGIRTDVAREVASTMPAYTPDDFPGTTVEFPKYLDAACRRCADRAVAGLEVTPETTARHEAEYADRLWAVELIKAFGKHAGDERYTSKGKGELGSALRDAHDRYTKAADAWHHTLGMS